MDNFYGKYRGKVANNLDPQQIGRLQVSVPAVLADGQLAWAMPCVPYAGQGVGFFALPPIGANVWIEFEGGSPDHPIWSGGFWDPGQVPATPAVPMTKVFKTDGAEIVFDDTPGAGRVTIQVSPPFVPVPLRIELSADGIQLTGLPGAFRLAPAAIDLGLGAASIKLSPVTVSINNGALEVS